MGKTYRYDGQWWDLRDDADYAEITRRAADKAAALRGEDVAPVAAVGPSTPAPKTAKAQTVAADPAKAAQLAEALAYVASYTGTWGLPLDIKASPAFGTKWMRLSDRQVEALLAGKARDAARIDAARLASELYADDEYSKHMAQQAAPAAAPKAAWRPAARVEQDGMYLTPDGTVYKVQAAKVQGSGHLYAKRLVVEDGTGTFVYAPGAITRLDASMRMTLDQAKAYGKLYGVCCKCGSPLTDEVSIANGIGPVCAGKGWAD